MIKVFLSGGLGNQLFQYAIGIVLSKKNNVCLEVDITRLNKSDTTTKSFRYYKLDKLIQAPKTTSTSRLGLKIINLKIRFTKYFKKVNNKILIEKSFAFDKEVLETKRNSILIGNWQSDKYFRDFRDLILYKFNFKIDESDAYYKEMQSSINESNSVSIHIRRGDYVTNKVANEILGVLPLQYYENAIKLIKSDVINPVFFIFSDELDWVKSNLKFDNLHYFIKCEGENIDIKEFELMKKCKHNIIANSSFSWWAAWLNLNPNKIVIAPKKWFGPKGPNNFQDIYPDGWIKL